MCSFSGATCTSRDVTMQITFRTRKSVLTYRRDLRQRVASLTLNCNGVLAIRAYGAGCHMRLGAGCHCESMPDNPDCIFQCSSLYFQR